MRIGKVTESVLKRSILKLIHDDSNKESAAEGSDCAYSILEEEVASAMGTVTFKSANSAYFAVHTAVNNLLCAGAVTRMVTLNIMLSPDIEESELKDIVRSAKKAANEAGISVTGGHTEVTDALSRPIITAVATGTMECTEYMHSYKNVRPDMDIVMTGYAGLAGTSVLAELDADKLRERLPDYMIRSAADFYKDISVRKAACTALGECGQNTYLMHDISNGGVFAALWELAERARCGLDIDLKKIPIRQETVEITNYLSVNPYQLLSTGSLLIITDDGENLVRRLEAADVPAAIIGVTTGENSRIIRNEDETRYLDKPQTDELVRYLSQSNPSYSG